MAEFPEPMLSSREVSSHLQSRLTVDSLKGPKWLVAWLWEEEDYTSSLKAILFLAFILLEKKWKPSHQRRQNDWYTIFSFTQVDVEHFSWCPNRPKYLCFRFLESKGIRFWKHRGNRWVHGDRKVKNYIPFCVIYLEEFTCFLCTENHTLLMCLYFS